MVVKAKSSLIEHVIVKSKRELYSAKKAPRFMLKHVKINEGSIQKVSQNKIMQTISMLQNQKSEIKLRKYLLKANWVE